MASDAERKIDNNQHARDAWRALKLADYRNHVDDLETSIVDLLCDLRHLIDRAKLDPLAIAEMASNHYQAELTGVEF